MKLATEFQITHVCLQNSPFRKRTPADHSPLVPPLHLLRKLSLLGPNLRGELQFIGKAMLLYVVNGTSTHTTQNYLAIKFDGNALIYVRFRKNEISCELPRGNTYPDGSRRGRFFEIDDPKGVTKVRTWNWKSGVTGSVYNFSLSKSEEIDYRMFLVKQRYELVN